MQRRPLHFCPSSPHPHIHAQNLGSKTGSRADHTTGLAFGCSQLILFLFYCLAFWFGGIQARAVGGPVLLLWLDSV